MQRTISAEAALLEYNADCERTEKRWAVIRTRERTRKGSKRASARQHARKMHELRTREKGPPTGSNKVEGATSQSVTQSSNKTALSTGVNCNNLFQRLQSSQVSVPFVLTQDNLCNARSILQRDEHLQ